MVRGGAGGVAISCSALFAASRCDLVMRDLTAQCILRFATLTIFVGRVAVIMVAILFDSIASELL